MSRRGNSEGSVYKRASDGRWVASWKDPDGKRRVSYHSSAKAAQLALRGAQTRVDRGQPGVDSSSTFQTAFERWRRTSLMTSGLDPKSQRVYVDTVKLHVIPTIGESRLRDLRAADISEVFAEMASAGLSTAYQRQAKKATSHVLKWAIREGLILTNVTQGVMPVPVDTPSKAVPTTTQVRALIEAAPTSRLRAAVGLWAYAALRIAESLDLTWDAVDVPGAALHVVGKGGRPRSVPMSAPLREILTTWRRAQAEMRLASAWWSEGPDYVITTEIGTRCDEHNIRKEFRPWAQPIVAGVTPHSMRHAAATALMESGANPKVVSELLGHSSVRITLDVYTRVRPEMARQAADELGRAIGGV